MTIEEQRNGHDVCRRSHAGMIVAVALMAGTGCKAPKDVDPSPMPEARIAFEQSVRPGVNDPYQDTDAQTWVRRFESESREIFRHRRDIVDAVGIVSGMVVADVGAGTGLFTELFAGAVGPAGKVYAVDITQVFLDHINARTREKQLHNVETVLCSEDSIDLAANSVDLVFLCDTYHHFEFPQSTMRSVWQALRPGGVLVVIDFQRVPGVSRAWVLNHVRAGRGVITVEIIRQGFELIDTDANVDFLQENYFLRFRKPAS